MRARLGLGDEGCWAVAEAAEAMVTAPAASRSDRVGWRMLIPGSSRGAKRKASAYGKAMAALETGVIVVAWSVMVIVSSTAR